MAEEYENDSGFMEYISDEYPHGVGLQSDDHIWIAWKAWKAAVASQSVYEKDLSLTKAINNSSTQTKVELYRKIDERIVQLMRERTDLPNEFAVREVMMDIDGQLNGLRYAQQLILGKSKQVADAITVKDVITEE